VLAGGKADTVVHYFRPVDNSPLRFEHTAGTNFTGAVSACSIEAKDPVSFDLLPLIREF
jgi:hypothetical protein